MLLLLHIVPEQLLLLLHFNLLLRLLLLLHFGHE